MAVYALSGKCYTAPTAAHGGGTIVPGIVDDIQDSFSIRIPAPIDLCRVGLGAKGGIESRAGHEGPLLLLLPLKDNSAAARTLLFSHLTADGAAMAPTGTGVTGVHAKPPSFAMVVRPNSATELHLYSPAWRIADNAELQAIFSETIPHFGPNILPLIANRAPGQTTRAWLWAAAAAINTEYSLTEP